MCVTNNFSSTSVTGQCASSQETWEIEIKLLFTVMWRKFMLTIAFMV